MIFLPPALQNRRFRLLWLGLLISIAGTQMQLTAILWHISEISDQPIALGAVGLVNILPVLALSLLAGVFADAVNRRRLMFLTQTTMALLAAGLGWATLSHLDSLWLIYLVTAATASVSTFDLPARQSLVPNLVSESDLTNAFTMTSIAFQLGSIAGPALAGLVLAQLGIGYAYLLNALSYLAVIVALILMGPVTQELVPARSRPDLRSTLSGWRSSVSEGLDFVVRQPIIMSSMLLDFFATFFSSATVLLPLFSKDILKVDVVGYGWLVAAPSVGAALVALLLAFARQIRRQGLFLLSAVAGFGVATVVFGLSKTFWITYAALVLTGATDGFSTIIRNTVRQLLTPDRLRGRMTSVNQIFFRGGPQLGELEAGLVAQALGPVVSVVSGGIGCILATVWVWRRYPELERFQGDEPVLKPVGALGG
jgi:MFS family permease